MVARLRIATLGMLLLLAATSRADYDGGVPGMFLNYGGSPRTLAMGKAFCGLADDAEAAYFQSGRPHSVELTECQTGAFLPL